MMLLYTVLVPIFCEAESLVELSDRVQAMFTELGAADDFELLFVDDGSTDGTADLIGQMATERPYVRALHFRRNFGKSLALMAGFLKSRGRVIITMDGDLQDMPEDIPALIAKLESGFDLVSGLRVDRNDTGIRKLGSRLYNTVVRRVTGLELSDLNCGFKAYRQEVVKTLCIYGQYHRFIPLQAHLVGFRCGEVPVRNSARKHGQSKFRTLRWEGLFDLLSMLFTYRFGLAPLHFFGVVSVILIAPAGLIVAYLMVMQLLHWAGTGLGYMVVERPMLSMSLSSMLMGLIVFLTGFVCDFVLHHQIRSRIGAIVDMSIARETDGRPIADVSDAPAQSDQIT
jgi:glycosyltransferase involved in cell wall biosynthesis